MDGIIQILGLSVKYYFCFAEKFSAGSLSGSNLTFVKNFDTLPSMFKTKLMDISSLLRVGPTAATDLALILGAGQFDGCYDNCGRRTSQIISATPNNSYLIGGMGPRGEKILIDPFDGRAALRLALFPASAMAQDTLFQLKQDNLNRWTFQHGFYPQQAPSVQIQSLLEEKYQTCTLAQGTQRYRLNVAELHYDEDNEVCMLLHETYVQDGFSYCRVRSLDGGRVLSNGQVTQEDAMYWVQVAPITWIYEPQTRLAYSDMALVAGVLWQANAWDSFYPNLFRYDSSDVAAYLTKFDQEILQPMPLSHQNQPQPARTAATHQRA